MGGVGGPYGAGGGPAGGLGGIEWGLGVPVWGWGPYGAGGPGVGLGVHVGLVEALWGGIGSRWGESVGLGAPYRAGGGLWGI